MQVQTRPPIRTQHAYTHTHTRMHWWWCWGFSRVWWTQQNFALEKMDWPKHYSSEKVLVLMTYTELMNKKNNRGTAAHIQPIRCVGLYPYILYPPARIHVLKSLPNRIYKARVRNGVNCFEVIWKKPGDTRLHTTHTKSFFILPVEELALVYVFWFVVIIKWRTFLCNMTVFNSWCEVWLDIRQSLLVSCCEVRSGGAGGHRWRNKCITVRC